MSELVKQMREHVASYKSLSRHRSNCLALCDLVDELEALLKIAKCPDTNCDGKGNLLLGEYQQENGEVEQHLAQCQWCDERADLLTGGQ